MGIQLVCQVVPLVVVRMVMMMLMVIMVMIVMIAMVWMIMMIMWMTTVMMSGIGMDEMKATSATSTWLSSWVTWKLVAGASVTATTWIGSSGMFIENALELIISNIVVVLHCIIVNICVIFTLHIQKDKKTEKTKRQVKYLSVAIDALRRDE